MSGKKKYARRPAEKYIESPAAVCPFYIQETARSRRIAIFCEGGKLVFRNIRDRAVFEIKNCYSQGYTACTVARHLTERYNDEEKEKQKK